MDERIDILDSEGNFTGKTELKSHAHRMGLFHNTVHIWFYTSDGQILLQQRGKNKEIHPLLWDVSVAGHIGAGEAIKLAALREVEEEIGLIIYEDSLEKIGIFKSIEKHHNDLADCEFRHSFLCELKVPLEQLRKQESEVEALKLIPLLQFNNELKDLTKFSYVPHNILYYETIYKQIRQRLKAL